MEIQEKNRRGIPLWNITPDYKQELTDFQAAGSNFSLLRNSFPQTG